MSSNRNKRSEYWSHFLTNSATSINNVEQNNANEIQQDNDDEKIENEIGDYIEASTNLNLNPLYQNDPAKGKLTAAEIQNYGPLQPFDIVFPFRIITGKQRAFQSLWFFKPQNQKEKRNWLEYSPTLDMAFCIFCRHYSTIVSKFVTGHNNWKKFGADAEEHELTTYHKNSFMKYIYDLKDESKKIENLLKLQLTKQQANLIQQEKDKKYYISKLFEIIKFLSCQSLALEDIEKI